jgi:hypothetical protein
MIESLDELMSGKRVNLHGDIDVQMSMHRDGTARLLVHQTDALVVMDAHQIAHLARVFRAMIQQGGDLNGNGTTERENR